MKKNLNLLKKVLCLMSMGIAALVLAAPEKSDGNTKDAVTSLVVSSSLDSKGRLLFQLNNKTAKEVRTTPVGTNYSRITITTPSGKAVDYFAWEDGIEDIKVLPGKSYQETLDMLEVFEALSLTEKGVYQIVWHIKGQADLKSNTLYLDLGFKDLHLQE